MRTWIIAGVSAVVVSLILIVLFFNIMHGFPWERKTADDAAREYVVNNYNLTPVKTVVNFLFDTGGLVIVHTFGEKKGLRLLAHSTFAREEMNISMVRNMRSIAV